MSYEKSTFKPNVFQKILIVFYITAISIIGIFYVPFRHAYNNRFDDERNYKTDYDFIWSSGGSIDLYRIIIYMVILTGLFYFAYKYLSGMNDLDKEHYNRKAKIELYIFVFFIISIPIAFLYLYVSNTMTISKRVSIETKIREADSLIALKTKKKQDRLIFWNISNDVFNDMYQYDNNIENYWVGLMNSLWDEKWFDGFYHSFNKKRLEWIGIYNKEQLAIFIRNNVINDEDRIDEDRVKFLKEDKVVLYNEKDKTSLYDIKISFIYCILTMFVLLYILRPFVAFIIGMFRDIDYKH